MVTSPRFLLGIAAGAAVAWWWRRRHGPRLVTVAPYSPIALSRMGRRGQGWSGSSKVRGSQI